MTTWCLAHPWMTFWLILITVLCVDNSICTLKRKGEK